MKAKIGETAGRIWQMLRENSELSVAQLPKALKEKDALVHQALGWLAREDKINFHTKGNKTSVTLK